MPWPFQSISLRFFLPLRTPGCPCFSLQRLRAGRTRFQLSVMSFVRTGLSLCGILGIQLRLLSKEQKTVPQRAWLSRSGGKLYWCLALLLSVMVGVSPTGASEGKQPFSWSQDAYWQGLEQRYRVLRSGECRQAAEEVAANLDAARGLLQQIAATQLEPDAGEFTELERRIFELGPVVAACGVGASGYISLVTDVRSVVKQQSERWDMTSEQARVTLYRLLYGGRGALEEVMAQMQADDLPDLIEATDEPSSTPFMEINGVRAHSGDILVSRGGAATSALIARGNDYPGNFSHIALVSVDPATRKARIIESHIERGVVISSVEDYFADKKLRVMLLRLRANLPALQKNGMLPHQAAELAIARVHAGHVPYDFAMDYKDHSHLFCSEVASAAYEQVGVQLWARMSHMSAPGLQRWLRGFGVRHFETQEPSDLEYDPQLRVVAEWRDLETLRHDRYDNAVTDVMLEGAEAGDDLTSRQYLLPVVGAVKGVSLFLNLFGGEGPVPEGMTASAALSSYNYDGMHRQLKEKLILAVERFRRESGYEPPYWVLVELARKVKQQAAGQ